MATSLTLSVLEIILLFFGAVILGITIHFFIASRKSLNADAAEMQASTHADKNEWKLKYLNDMEMLDREMSTLKHQLQESEENVTIYSIEADEMRLQNKRLQKEIEAVKKEMEVLQKQPAPLPVQQPQPQQPILQPQLQLQPQQPAITHKGDYLDQLLQAQNNLMEHNQKINDLLGNIDFIKEKEEKQRQMLLDNEELSAQISNMQMELLEKEKEITSIKQKEQLTREMTSMLDSAYSEFNTLQSKIQKMESQLTASKMENLHYEDLKEEHTKLNRDFEEQKLKAGTLLNENQQLRAELTEAEDKFREANFQRQQLQKRIGYLEELNRDFQMVSDANKKLENQLKRIGELESMLNVASGENVMNRRQE